MGCGCSKNTDTPQEVPQENFQRMNKEEFRAAVSKVLKDNDWLKADHQVVIGGEDDHRFKDHECDTGHEDCVCLMNSYDYDALFEFCSNEGTEVESEKWNHFVTFASSDPEQEHRDMVENGFLSFKSGFEAWHEEQVA